MRHGVFFRKISLVCASAVLFAGCINRAFNQNAQVTHTASRTGVAPNSSYWANLSEKELDGFVFNKNSIFSEIPLQQTDSNARQYLQALSDSIYDVLKSHLQGRDKARFIAPKPKVYIVLNKNFNAFVARNLVRFPVKINHIPEAYEARRAELEQSLKAGDLSQEMIAVDTDYNSDINLVSSSSHIASAPLGDSSQLNEVLLRENAYLKQQESTCAFAKWNKVEATLSGDCETVLLSNWFASKQILPAIFIHAGMLSGNYKLEDVVGVVAHELGHYLMAHNIVGASYNKVNNLYDSRYNYLYNEADYIRTGEPKPLAKELVTNAEDAIVNILPLVIEQMPGEIDSIYALYSLARPDIAAFLINECSFVGANSEICDNVSKVSKKINTIYTSFAKQAVSQELLDLLKSYSSILMQFANKIKVIKSTYNSALPTCENKVNTAAICQKSLLDPRSFGRDYQTYSFVMMSVDRVVGAKEELSLLDWIKIVKQEYETIWKKNEERKNFLIANDIGWYSFEQQADDIGMEAMAALGVDFNKFIDFSAQMASLFSEKDLAPVKYVSTLGYPEAKACTELAKLGFKNPNQQWLRVRNVDWEDEHHNMCYRAFNMVHELALHKYKIKPMAPQFKSLVNKFDAIKIEAAKLK